MGHYCFFIATFLLSFRTSSSTYTWNIPLAPSAKVTGKLDSNLKAQAQQWMYSQSIKFLENKGQMMDMQGKPVNDLLFKADANGVDMYITKWGLSYIFIKEEAAISNSDKVRDKEQEKGVDVMTRQKEENKKIEYCRADMELKGATIHKENIIKEYESQDFSNYYLGHCSDGILNVRRYGRITIQEVYPKIDWMIYTGKNGSVKYDFIVHPGGNPENIILKYKWTDSPHKKDDGSLGISTPMGTITEGAPYSYTSACSAEGQETNSQIQTVYTVNEETGEICFTMDYYDPHQTLIIDPQLKWGTYYGGSNYEGFCSVKTDGSGNMFVSGYVDSPDFPTLNPGGVAYFQGTSAGSKDAFILKFNNSGVLLWATYYGGDGFDEGSSLAIDGSGNVFVTGLTGSTNFPTLNPGGGSYFQGVFGGGIYAAFLLKFSNAGTLLWATYYGGNDFEYSHSIAIDGNGNVFVTGQSGTNLPTLNPGGGTYFQAANAGSDDVFLLKFNNSGVLLWATYYGGSGSDVGYSLAIDRSDNIFVTGYTRSANFPILNPGGGAYFQGVYAGGMYDSFILKLNNNGVLIWATFYGGSINDTGYSLATDDSGNVFITGGTSSLNFPTYDPGGGAYFQGTNAGGLYDVFILKFSNSGVQLWATYYGGSNSDYFFSNREHEIVVDGSGNMYMTGRTNSTNFPIFNPGGGAYFQGSNAGGYDIFLLQFSNSGILLWATYNGTPSGPNELGAALAIDPGGCLITVGEWGGGSSNGLMNPGGGAYYTASFGGADDSYIMKFCPATSILSVSVTSSNPLCNGQCTGTAAATPSNGAIPYTYSWNTLPVQTTQAATGLCAGIYTVTVDDAMGNTTTATVSITNPAVLTATITSTSSSCGNNNGTATATASGGTSPYTYVWASGGQSTSTITGLAAGNYTATITDANGCTQTQTVPVTSINALNVNVSSTQTGCIVNNGTATAIPLNGTAPYTYSWNNGQTTATATGLAAGTYTVTATDSSGCTQTQTATVTTLPGPVATANANPVAITVGDSVQLSATGGGTYFWNNGATEAVITVSPSATTAYCVTVTDTNGCTDTACVTVVVALDCSDAGELYLPNAFSPNNDGENDKLQIYYGNLKCIKTFNLIIYNRWGEKVFEDTNPMAQWDGFYNGKPENASVFVYYMEATLISGEEIIRKGNVSLIK